MKKILITITFVSTFVCASLTQWEWSGTPLSDENGTTVSSGTPNPNYVALTVFSDLNLSVSGGQIDIADINAAIFHPYISTLDVSTSGPFSGFYVSDLFSDNTDTYAGQTAYLLIHQGNGSIQVGDFIGLSVAGQAVVDLDPPGAIAPAPQQSFDGGSIITNITVIPEPSTMAVLLMGILGLVKFRKYLRK